MVDPIADMLTRIRNANAVRKTTVDIPYSKLKEQVAKVLKEHGFIDKVAVKQEKFPTLELTLAAEDAQSPITSLIRVSKPGRRVYVTKQDIPTVLRGRGIVVMSTAQGVMSGDKARKTGVGGELMCKVW